jgi:valyl-tRNA synthetase
LWNAARYVLMNTEDMDCGQNGSDVLLSAADRWIISRLQKTEIEVTSSIEKYRFDLAAQAIYTFIWDEYCDWYLELSKPVLTGASSPEAALRGTRRTLVRVMETVLRLIHPFTPYISEEIWQRMAPLAGIEADTIMRQPYPAADPDTIDHEASSEVEWVKKFIIGVRKIRSGMNIDPRKMLPVLLQGGTSIDKDRLSNNLHYIISVGRIESATWLNDNEEAPESSTVLVDDMKILIPLAGLIDKEAEVNRLAKELERKTSELERCKNKLSNSSFIDKAPAAVVEKEQAKAAELCNAISNLLEQQQKIQSL